MSSNRMMGLNLSDGDVAALESRTEGLIAGLQKAALSMQGRGDSASFIQAFTGSHRFVLDYLAEEVLGRQSESIRNFLLQTSILDRLCVSICSAVTERQDSKELLDILERSNLFLIPLDDQRQWYRYHRLFADVLQTRLMEAQQGDVTILHSRASAWYEQNGLRSDAIRHALAARDFARAADLIELALFQTRIASVSSRLCWVGSSRCPTSWFGSDPCFVTGIASHQWPVKDDSAGGDTNRDGTATSPAPGDWGGLGFGYNSADQTLTGTEVRYAGAHDWWYGRLAAVYARSTSASLTSCRITGSSSDGLLVHNGSITMTGSRVEETAGFSVRLMDAALTGSVTGCPHLESIYFEGNGPDVSVTGNVFERWGERTSAL